MLVMLPNFNHLLLLKLIVKLSSNSTMNCNAILLRILEIYLLKKESSDELEIQLNVLNCCR